MYSSHHIHATLFVVFVVSILSIIVPFEHNLDKWRVFEEANSKAFVGMYQFWCQKI